MLGVAVRPIEVGVEVFEHLRPEVVDGAVAFVGDDDVEGLDGDGWVVLDGRLLPEQALQAMHGGFVVFLGQLPALEHGVHALDGADADPRRGVEGVAAQALDDVLLAELEVFVGVGEVLATSYRTSSH